MDKAGSCTGPAFFLQSLIFAGWNLFFIIVMMPIAAGVTVLAK